MKTFILILLVACSVASCSSSKEAGVIVKTKKARLVGGNAKHFQQRKDAKLLKKAKAEYNPTY